MRTAPGSRGTSGAIAEQFPDATVVQGDVMQRIGNIGPAFAQQRGPVLR
jgi:hypothetical protein